MNKFIYHIHHKCCGHATNTIEDLVQYAKSYGYQKLYLTEHSPLVDNQFLYRPSKIDIENLKKEIEVTNKNNPDIKIYLGFETEYPKIHRDYFDKYRYDSQCDYLIFGNHFYGDMWQKNPRFTMKDTHT